MSVLRYKLTVTFARLAALIGGMRLTEVITRGGDLHRLTIRSKRRSLAGDSKYDDPE